MHGVDEHVSSAIIGDTGGKAVEILYLAGMFKDRNKLLRHDCSRPTRLVAETNSPYSIPVLHCEPWPPQNFRRDHIFW